MIVFLGPTLQQFFVSKLFTSDGWSFSDGIQAKPPEHWMTDDVSCEMWGGGGFKFKYIYIYPDPSFIGILISHYKDPY